MGKHHLVLLWSFLGFMIPGFTQEGFFSWSVGGAELNMAFIDLEIMSDQSVIAITRSEGNGARGSFLQADGTATSLRLWGEGTAIIKFSPDGQVLWQKSTNSNYGKFYKVEKNEAGEIIVLSYVEGQYEYQEDYEEDYGEDEYEEESSAESYAEEKESEDEESEAIYVGDLPDAGLNAVKAGCHILHFSLNGGLIKDIHVPVLNEIDIEDCQFKTYQQGEYLISGTGGAELLSERLEQRKMGDNNEFVLAIDQEGELEWGDMIFHRKSEGYLVGGGSLTSAPDGTVYYAGTYPYGATFSNGMQTLVPVSYENLQKNYEHREGFVISYNLEGEINWIRTDGVPSYMGAITAVEEGVFVSHRTSMHKLFGQKVDTTGRKALGISFLNKEGLLDWTMMAGVDQIHQMEVNPQGNAVMLGSFRSRSGFLHNSGKMGPFTIPEKHESFITAISPEGEFQWLKSNDLWITTQNEPFTMAIDGDDSIVIAGLMWLILPFEISKLDPSLPKIKASGGVMIMGRIR